MRKSNTVPKRGSHAHGNITVYTALRVSKELHDWIVLQAKKEDISRAALIIQCIEEGRTLRSGVKNGNA